MKRNIICLSILIWGLLLMNCVDQKKTGSSDSSQGEKSVAIKEMNLDYSKHIQPIIVNRCNKCHSGLSDKYASLTDKEQISKLKRIIKNDIMPKDSPLKKENKELVLSWLDSKN